MRKPALRKLPLAFSIFTLLFLTAPADSSAQQPGGVQTDQMTPAQREAQIQRLDKRIKELEKLVKEREQRAKKWHRRADRTEAQGFDVRLPYGSGSRDYAEDWERKAADARGELEKAKEERERLKRGGATPPPTGEPNPDSGPGAGTAPPQGSPEAVPEPVAPTPQEVEPRPDTKPTEQMPAPPADQPAGPSRRDLEKQIKDAEKAAKKFDREARDNDRRANSWTRRAEDAERIGRTELAEENRRIAEGFRKDAEKARQQAEEARGQAEEARRRLQESKTARSKPPKVIEPGQPVPVPPPAEPGTPEPEPEVPGRTEPPSPPQPGTPPSGEKAPAPSGFVIPGGTLGEGTKVKALIEALPHQNHELHSVRVNGVTHFLCIKDPGSTEAEMYNVTPKRFDLRKTLPPRQGWVWEPFSCWGTSDGSVGCEGKGSFYGQPIRATISELQKVPENSNFQGNLSIEMNKNVVPFKITGQWFWPSWRNP